MSSDLEDQRAAWEMHEAGNTWAAIGAELGCSQATAQAIAGAYERRTDAGAAANQTALF